MNDFDFFVGTWDVANRRLLKRGVGSDEWEEFPGRCVAYGFFDGAGSFDTLTLPTKDFDGATVRTYDAERDEWSIYWINSRRGLDPVPVVGRFVGGVGTFYADDTDDGRPIRVRFTWSGITPDSCHWEQAFSYDAGQTWETNWIMDSTRVG
ncbi:hypothetical protein DI270_016085 [Microbispora triticiradicis]|uniref:DUF1579 domain-containing protein n=3 Tax=Microbispora TaxID=2005 RepID=A0ABY3M344_9ACTN|nr:MULTISPECIES: hypothetical protein [Microbispora]RGA03966.1 hypothetical protein DI270_016085 [Microbispora triticiradicis]TLP53996.1 hypothetical protein FED44_28530 [Microbispora fusca]TYB65150.1 hypothetical protein FXF59_06745 [Microbispora tritici]GLW24950.1 hypothetical protein Mame01_49920 [Microbispora amethystogenes]